MDGVLITGRPFIDSDDGFRAGPPPINQPPVTAPDSASTFENTPVLVNVLANDSDPEGGVLTLTGASATDGSVVVQGSDQLLYTPQAGFTGSDQITYDVADPFGVTAQGLLTITVQASTLSITPTAQGTLLVEADAGEVDITVTSPAEFAGSYTFDTADLDAGPVMLAPPGISGIGEVGQSLTALSGLWVFSAEAPTESWAWRRDGTDIAGATGTSYQAVTADAGTDLSLRQSLSNSTGSRSATSAPLAISTPFQPDGDAGLLAWFDASDLSTLTESGGLVSAWADKTGTFSLGGAGGNPQTGGRTLGGLNTLDFAANAHLTGNLTLPANGDMAFHMMLEIDSLTNAFAAVLAVEASQDFQLDANSNTQFDGRLNVAGSGDTVALSGGPYAGAITLSLLFDATSGASSEVWINGMLVGSGAYSSPFDSATMLHIMTNRSKNAFIDGAVGEVIVTTNLANRGQYQAYLSEKWGFS